MQREDASLMADILREMFKQKVLAYPIHDSVVVPGTAPAITLDDNAPLLQKALRF